MRTDGLQRRLERTPTRDEPSHPCGGERALVGITAFPPAVTSPVFCALALALALALRSLPPASPVTCDHDVA